MAASRWHARLLAHLRLPAYVNGDEPVCEEFEEQTLRHGPAGVQPWP